MVETRRKSRPVATRRAPVEKLVLVALRDLEAPVVESIPARMVKFLVRARVSTRKRTGQTAACAGSVAAKELAKVEFVNAEQVAPVI